MAAPSGIQPQTLAADAHRAGGGGSEEPPHALDVARFRRLNSLIHRENVDADELLNLVGRDNRVNLMNDPLLSVVISCKKPKLACSLIDKISSNDILKASNLNGDTALHVAAAMDDKEVASKLIDRVPDLVHMQNVKQEIPLHKAALYGLLDMFRLLVENNSSPKARREDGATMLHCAIMGNAPGLALEIAKRFPLLITSRNTMAVTPLQLMVTVPGLFRSQMVLVGFESILLDFIPLEKDSDRTRRRDEEEASGSSNDAGQAEGTEQDDHEYFGRQRTIRSRFPSCCCTLVDRLVIPVKWVPLFLFIILKTCE